MPLADFCSFRLFAREFTEWISYVFRINGKNQAVLRLINAAPYPPLKWAILRPLEGELSLYLSLLEGDPMVYTFCRTSIWKNGFILFWSWFMLQIIVLSLFFNWVLLITDNVDPWMPAKHDPSTTNIKIRSLIYSYTRSRSSVWSSLFPYGNCLHVQYYNSSLLFIDTSTR